MKPTVAKEAAYSLRNAQHYNKELEVDLTDATAKIAQLFVVYVTFMTETLRLKKSKLSRFIVSRGLDTVVNVLHPILLYTKNMDVAYYHCQKAFYFYAEFVGQITEEDKMYLQLSSRDAVTYVYKKTIFDITPQLKQQHGHVTERTRHSLDLIDAHVQLYKTLLLKLIHSDTGSIATVKDLYAKLNGVTQLSTLSSLNNLLDTLYHVVDDGERFFDVCGALIKKGIKHPEVLVHCSNHCLEADDFRAKVNEPTDKFIRWFTRPQQAHL